MLAKIIEERCDETQDLNESLTEQVCLVLRKWKTYQAHIGQMIEKVEILKEDGTVQFLYNQYEDDDWSSVWCHPNGKQYFYIRFEDDKS